MKILLPDHDPMSHTSDTTSSAHTTGFGFSQFEIAISMPSGEAKKLTNPSYCSERKELPGADILSGSVRVPVRGTVRVRAGTRERSRTQTCRMNETAIVRRGFYAER